jgi:hypothetical protein
MARAPADLEAYREEAERFVSALDEEFYLHFSGRKGELELAPIYERHADLATLDACERLRAAAEDGSRGGVELWRFACERRLEAVARAEIEEIARLEASLSAEVDGEEIGFRLLVPAIGNEPDRGRRERLERARAELVNDHLNRHYRAAAEAVRAETARLGAPTYRELYERFGFPLERVAEQCRAFLADTEDLYVRALDDVFRRRVAVPLEEAERWDVRRLFRAPDWDAGFPRDAMLPALESTLAGLGIDLRSQRNVEIDVEPRPKKHPRAFCAPIDVPGRVVLVIQPIGGVYDWQALFHEAGHTEHFAHTSAALPFEARRLGDDAVTEGWAMLVEHLVSDPAWLSRRLDFARPEEFAAEAAAGLLYVVRLLAAKLLYEVELHAGAPLDEMPSRYVDWMREGTKVEHSPTDFLAGVDPGFYSTSYLRAFAFEAQVRAFLREEFGRTWFTRREAGSLLRELWAEGQGLRADEILDELTGGEVELGAVGEDMAEAVR